MENSLCQQLEQDSKVQQAVGGRPPRYATAPSSSRGRRNADDNVAAISHGQHVPTLTAAAA